MALARLAMPPRTAGQKAEPDRTPPDASFSPPAGFLEALSANLGHDQKSIWSFPGRLVQGQNWILTAAVLGTTA